MFRAAQTDEGTRAQGEFPFREVLLQFFLLPLPSRASEVHTGRGTKEPERGGGYKYYTNCSTHILYIGYRK